MLEIPYAGEPGEPGRVRWSVLPEVGPPPMKRRTRLYDSTYQITYHEVRGQGWVPVHSDLISVLKRKCSQAGAAVHCA